MHIATLLLFFIPVFIVASCGKGPCVQTDTVGSSNIVISFIDKQTGQYLYKETNSVYSVDSLRIYEEGGRQLDLQFALTTIPNSNSRYYVIAAGSLYNPQTDQNSFNREICKNLLIRYKFNDLDTIKACFKSKQADCNSFFETIIITSRDTVISSLANNNYPIITLYKD